MKSYVVHKVKQNQHRKEITATSMKDVLKHGPVVLSDLCAIRGWQNVFGSLECTQEAAGYLITASVSTWAFADTAGLESQNLDCVYIEGWICRQSSIFFDS